LGNPTEYFDKTVFELDYPTKPELQLREALKRGTTPNGVCGIKIFCDAFDRMGKLDWLSGLPSPHFIHLERQDTLGQAVSFAKALQTRQWTSTGKPIASPAYDEELIVRCLNMAAFDRTRWQLFFARNAISPLWLTYEKLVTSMPECVLRIADMLEIPMKEADLLVQPSLEKQADHINDDWKARFLASKRDWTYLDTPSTDLLSPITFLSLSKRALARRLVNLKKHITRV
jgi:trehalose 2-sulfotransferase